MGEKMGKVIQVNKLTKIYKTFKRNPGFINVISSLFYRKYEDKVAVNDVSFTINEGEFVGFLGPNGAGKTTTLKMLSGILYPTSGNVSILGFTPWKRQKEYQGQMSIVMGQKNQLWFDLPAKDSFELLTDIYNLDRVATQKWVDELAKMLDVDKYLTTQVRRLSLGERMKMELIAALIHKPKILFLDEPTIGLDIVSQKKIREFLKKINKEEHVTILLTSHYMEDISDLCERVIIINQGKVIYDAALEKLIAKYETGKILHLTLDEAVEEKDFAKYGVVKEVLGNDITLSVDKKRASEVVKDILSNYNVLDFAFQPLEADEVISRVFTEGIKK
jgi:ABC-2 type transport system ATP-binding protein